MGRALSDRLDTDVLAWLGVPTDAPASERLRVHLVLVALGITMAGHAVNLVSMTVAYGGPTPVHVPALAFMAALMAGVLLLRRTRSAVWLGLYFTALYTAAVTASALIVVGDGHVSAGIHSSLLPAFVAVSALVGLIGSRRAALACALSCSAAVWALYWASATVLPAPGLEAAAYHRAFQAQTNIVMAAGTTLLVGRVVYRSLDRMERQRDRAERAEAARRSYTATISHEIRTPLSGLIGLSDFLAKTDLDGTQSQYTGLIRTSANNLLEIVNDLLDTARIEHGELSVVSKPLHPAALVDEVLGVFRTNAAGRGLWLGAEVEGGGHGEYEGLHGDPRYIRQVLTNLVSNALKFTTAGGVRVGVRPGPASGDLQPVMFYVQDTGPGVSAQDRTRIFERFTQTATAANSGTRGSGLGLHIAQRLVQAMGGRLEIASEEGRGACFHFTLPLRRTLPDRLAA